MGINLKIDNYFSTSFTAFGDVAEPQTVIYNHPKDDPGGLVRPGRIPVDTVLGSFTDESIHHSGVHEWYRWTMSPTSPDDTKSCERNFSSVGIFIFPLLLHPTVSPCESGWQWAITNPKPLLFPVERTPPNLISSVEAASLVVVKNIGCSITFGGSTTILCIEQSSPFIIAEIDIPANAKYLSFDYLFSNIGDGDYAAVFLDETPIWKFMGTSFVGNEFINSGPIPIGQLEGTHELLIALYGVGELNAEFSVQNISFITPVPVTLVNIDIKPGSDNNCLNMNGHGVIPVAINGSATFEAELVDPATLVFNGLAVKVQGKKQKLACSLSDWNNDGFLDMVCKFEDDLALWQEVGTTVILTGELFDGTPIAGGDTICIVP